MRRKWLFPIIAICLLILLLSTAIGLYLFFLQYNDGDSWEERFSAKEGYGYAFETAKEWNDDALLADLWSKDAIELDGRNREWTYEFLSPSTAVNVTGIEPDHKPWRFDELRVTVFRENGSYSAETVESHLYFDEPELKGSRYPKDLDLDTMKIANRALETSAVREFLNETDTMWVDYRLRSDHWRLEICSVEFDPHLNNGILVICRYYPDTDEMVSYREDLELWG